MKSIIQKNTHECFLCGRNGRTDRLEKHHCLHGTANRKLAEKDGLFVYLCGVQCHQYGPDAAHVNPLIDQYLKAVAQAAWEDKYGSREDFIKRYGKSYL